MRSMQRSRFLFSAAALSIFVLVLGTLACQAQENRGRKYKAPPPTARIEVTVVRADDSKPVENAAVVFHTLKDEGSMELKSNEDGKAVIDVLPIGATVRLQIIAHGYQTFGQDYPINKASMAIEVRLNRPGKQYSIYQNHPNQNKDQNNKNQDQPQNKPQN